MMKYKYGVSIICLACAILISACSAPQPTLMAVQDNSLRQASSCMPPCWHGISPGKTGRLEAVETIKELDFVDPLSVQMNIGELWPGISSSIDWTYADVTHTGRSVEQDAAIEQDYDIEYDTGGSIYFDEQDVVKSIFIFFPQQLILGDIVSNIGPPDFISFAEYSGELTNTYFYRVFYEDKGLMLIGYLSGEKQNDEKALSESIRIDEAWYFSPRSLRDYYLMPWNGKTESQADIIVDTFVEWPGFSKSIPVNE